MLFRCRFERPMMLIDLDWQLVLPGLEMVLGFRGQEKKAWSAPSAQYFHSAQTILKKPSTSPAWTLLVAWRTAFAAPILTFLACFQGVKYVFFEPGVVLTNPGQKDGTGDIVGVYSVSGWFSRLIFCFWANRVAICCFLLLFGWLDIYL